MHKDSDFSTSLPIVVVGFFFFFLIVDLLRDGRWHLWGLKGMPSVQKHLCGGGAKMVEEKDGETNVSPTNTSKEHLNAE